MTWIPLLLGGGCGLPDLGDAPFFCNSGTPRCPEEYHCVANVCVRDGLDFTATETSSDKKDKGTRDGGPPPADTKPPPTDTKPPPTDTKPPPTDTKPPPTDTGGKVVILITEFMPNPGAVLDSAGEWLELYNPGNQAININGWSLKDLGQDKHVIAHTGPLMVPSKGYLVLGRNSIQSQNGGVKVGYQYKNFQLANNWDEVYLLDNNGKTIDSFLYSTAKGFNIPSGASLSVRFPGLDKNVAANWCMETKPWPGSQGDKGTPLYNPNCK